jgi:cobalt-zinc-cadmium efflux system protein
MKHHGHTYHEEISLRGKKLIVTIFLNLLITIAQVIGAIFANSLALLSDAFHNFSDTSSLLISFIANNLTRKKSTKEQTFGYKRAEIIAAFINASMLLIMALYIIYESVERIFSAEQVKVNPVIIMLLAGFSIIMNGLSVIIIYRDSKKNMNLKSAYLHLFTDMLSSIAVLIGGAAIYFFDLTIIDPILSVAIAIYLIIFGWKLVIQSIKVLMQFTPGNIDIEEIARDLSGFKEISNIHHAHAWQLNDNEIMFEAHVEFVEDLPISQACEVLKDMKKLLREHFDIHHTTFQPEFQVSCDRDLINQSHHHP